MSHRARRALWAKQDASWREPAQVTSLWEDARTNPSLLAHRTRGAWWQVLAEEDVMLFVTREYEHLVMAVGTTRSGPSVSYWPMPHPSGLALDPARGVLHLASTRNPNQVFDFAPASGLLARLDVKLEKIGKPLLPLASSFYPGSLYLHDLALIGGALHGAAAGQNAIVRLSPSGGW